MDIVSLYQRIIIDHQFRYHRVAIIWHYGDTELEYYGWIPKRPRADPDPHPEFPGAIISQYINVNTLHVARVKAFGPFEGVIATLTIPCWFLTILAGGPPLLWKLQKPAKTFARRLSNLRI